MSDLGKSLDILQDQLEKLKQLFPEAITEGKIDWEKLQATLGKENLEFLNERYVLNWAGKTDAFKVLQQPTTATLKPTEQESINFDKTENVFIEGENLEVLKVLQKAYYGKVKVVEIDPPYNTGNDSFIYPDSFKESKEEYQKRIGEKDEEGYLMKEGFFRKNSKDSGHFHSNWLSMMYPRLFLAKNLLTDDGVVFVHIDDNEVHNLRLLMNEIFGEENFFAQVIVRSNSRGQTFKQIAKTHEYILVYTKNFETDLNELEKDEENNDLNLKDDIGNYNIRELRNRNPKFGKHNRPNLFYPVYVNPKISDKDGFSPVSLVKNEKYALEVLPLNSEKKESCWRWGQKKCIANINEHTLQSNLIGKKKGDGSFGIYEKYRKTTYKPKSIWDDNSFLTETGTVELRELGFENVFDFPKPVALVKQIINLSIEDDDIVLDFFGGSGTTAQAVLEKNKEDGGNRKFILVQLPELCGENSEAYKAGYKTIADISKERIRRVIKKIEKEIKESKNLLNEDENKNLDLGFKVFKLASSNFKIWRGNEITEENLEQQLEVFTKPVKEGSEKENMLYELMLKAGSLLTDNVEAKEKYYSVNDGELIIALEEMNQKTITQIISAKPKKVITLDKLFTGNDQLKTNTMLQMRDAEIDFKTI
ncbi:MAG TPA: site-specific DNA-methyltransferase [Bacteroidia bacterium]|nr:site-specific DNA-methyltransferase [Bacteroidia bacterium]